MTENASVLLGSISGLLSFALVLLITTDVILRTLRFSMSGTLEISRLTLAWICFSALVYTYTTGSHVRVTIFTSRFSKRGQRVAEIIACLFGASLMLALFWKSVPFFWESWKVKEIFNVDVDLPYWLAKLSVAVGTFVFGLVYLIDLFANLVRFFQNNGKKIE
ncbi:MAG: TRAP transporter small permease [Deltaproteobacteria bacterium]|nr:TRAP transporter small permease [Deltaproteobacteria bacterium]